MVGGHVMYVPPGLYGLLTKWLGTVVAMAGLSGTSTGVAHTGGAAAGLAANIESVSGVVIGPLLAAAAITKRPGSTVGCTFWTCAIHSMRDGNGA